MPWASRSLGLSTPASLTISRTLFAVAGFIIRLFFPKTLVFIYNYRRFIPDLVFPNNFFPIFCGISIAVVVAGKNREGVDLSRFV
jgi:hypothetical protein